MCLCPYRSVDMFVSLPFWDCTGICVIIVLLVSLCPDLSMCVFVLTVLLMYVYHNRSVDVCDLIDLLMVLCHVVLFVCVLVILLNVFLSVV